MDHRRGRASCALGALAALVVFVLTFSGCYTQIKRAPRAEVEPAGATEEPETLPERHPPVAHSDHLFLTPGEPVYLGDTLLRLDRIRDNRTLVEGAQREVIGEATMYLSATIPGGDVERIRFITADRPSDQVITLRNGLTIRPVSLEPIRRFTGPPVPDNLYRLEIVWGYGGY